VPLEHDGLGVVEEPLPKQTSEVRRGAHERAAQRIHVEAEHEFGEARARVREDHDDHDLADVAPSTCACSPGSVSTRRKASAFGLGRAFLT
jgi:hypothetical protein